MRENLQRLDDILQAITEIKQYTKDGKQSFQENKLIQNAVIYQIIIIGEASNYISLELQQNNPHIPWSAMIGMRNILVHQYFEIDLKITWLVVENNLSELKRQIQELKKAQLESQKF